MKLGVCVPYRNREAHLKQFVPQVGAYLLSKGIEYCMYFGHQCDDKLFNRGAMKNVAAKHAFEDGCDYIVWHDIDMIPEEGTDYSFPEKTPIHIATNISQMNYELKYQEYFGGAVIFNKEQVEKTNGYSNDYWDWGMEDDDLFWRCYLEGYADVRELHIGKEEYFRFNGVNSKVTIPIDREIAHITSKSHTVSVLVKSNQQEEKVPIWLVGDYDRRFCEYPIIRRAGYDWGLSYNNSRAYTGLLWNHKKQPLYQWMKRYENYWSWVTLSVDTERTSIRSANNKIHFYLNGNESDARHGHGTHSPQIFDGKLKRYGSTPFTLGYTTSVGERDISKFFKGDIAKVMLWDRKLESAEIKELSNTIPTNGLKLHYEFKNGLATDLSGNGYDGEVDSITSGEELIKLSQPPIPHRRPGRMFCLEHEDEGLIKDGKGQDRWAKGETTARNERRYVLEMQQGNWDYKSDGIKQLKYELISVDDIAPNAKMINVKL